MANTRGARTVLARAVVVPLVVLLALAGYLVMSSALDAREVSDGVTRTAEPAEQPWRSSYSRRYPGCVAAVLWPGRESPRAVVIRWRSGQVQRVTSGVALRRALSAARADDGRIIGACYR